MMFSKAKVKRFNEEVGCAPAPTAYDPKTLDKPQAVTLDKSERWKENKENIPAPNAYNTAQPPSLRTPSKSRAKFSKPLNRTTSSTALDLSSISNCSSNSGSSSACKKDGFLTPMDPRLTRGGSMRGPHTKADEKAALVKSLQREKEDLQKMVADLKLKLATLEKPPRLGCTVSDKEAQTEDGEAATDHHPVTEEEGSVALLRCAEQQLAAAQSAVSALQDEKSGLLLQLQQLKITSPARETCLATEDTEPSLIEEEVQHLRLVRDNLEESLMLKSARITELEHACAQLASARDAHELQLRRCAELVLASEVQNTSDDGKKEEDEEDIFLAPAERVSALVSRYEALLASHDSLSAAHQQQLSALKQEVDLLKEKVAEYEKEVSSLQSKASERRDEVNALEEKVKELDLLIKEKDLMESVLQEEIRQRNHELSLLEEAYTAIETKLSEAEARNADATADKDKEDVEEKLQQATVALREAEVLQQFLEKELLNRENEISASEQKAEQLSQELSSTKREALDLRQEAEAQLNQVLVLRASLAAKDYDVDEREETILSLKEEIVTMTELVSDLQSMVASHKTTEADLKSQLEDKVKALLDVEEKISEANKKCSSFEEELAQCRSESETALACLKDMHAAELRDLTALKDEQTAQVRSLRQQCTTDEQTIAELEAKLADKSETVDRLEKKMVELMAELEEAEANHAAKLREARSELDDLSSQYSDTLLELDSTRRALTLTSEDHERVSLMLEAAEADVDKMKADLQTAKQEAREQADNCQMLEDNLRSLTAKYSFFEKNKLAEEAELSELVRRLQVELQLSKQDMTELKQEVSNLQSTNIGFMNQIQQLRQDLKKKSAAIEESKECIEVLREERRCALETHEQLRCEVDERVDEVRSLRHDTEELRQKVRDQESTIIQANECLESQLSSFSEERAKVAAERQLELKQHVEKHETLLKENEALQKQVSSMQGQLEAIVELKDSFALKIQALEDGATNLNAAVEAAEAARDKALSELQEQKSVQEELDEIKKREMENRVTIEQLNEKASEALSTVEKHRNELDDAVQQKLEVEKALAEKDAEIEALTAENERTRASEREACDALAEFKANHEACDELQSLMSSLTDHLAQTDEERREWKKKCDVLEKLVEPFREQLENYEVERSNLMSSKTAAQKELQDLSLKYASLLGHQNHKQKIQHVVKLKTSNLALQEEVAKLRADCDRQRKTIRRLEERLAECDQRKPLAGVTALQGTGKNNKENTVAVARSPLRPSNKLDKH